MPRFYENVEVDIDIDVDEFVSECNSEDIKDLIECLKENGYLTSENITDAKISYIEEKHQIYCNHLRSSYLKMSGEDMEVIENLAKKYGAY